MAWTDLPISMWRPLGLLLGCFALGKLGRVRACAAVALSEACQLGLG